jgi:signal transduction histidine kinase
VEVAEEQRVEGRWGLLHVVDEGPGIPPEFQARVFDRFAKGPDSAGLGLGLYLARRIAEAHNGTLTVESGPGRGSRFTLALPLRE